MKVLTLTNLYPPHVIGGYEALCEEAVAGLRARGHAVRVLTSTFGVGRAVDEGDVQRRLELESDLYFYQPTRAWMYPTVRRRNVQHLRDLVAAFQPDVAFIWGMWNMTKALAAEAERLLGARVVYYLANPWPIEPNMHQAYWDNEARGAAGRLAKRVLRVPARMVLRAEWEKAPLRFQHAPCCSRAQRDQLLGAGVPLQDAPVLYEGIDLGPYLAQAPNARPMSLDEPLRLVFVGNIARHKGVHTAIEALAHLPADSLARVHLTILGAGHPTYEKHLRDLVTTHDLTARVTFQPPIPRAQLPAFLGQFHALLLPSIWEEPLARIMQEGLASGMVVVGTATGGTKEIIVDGENGLLFAPEDAPGLARHIERLGNEPDLRQRLAAHGRRTASEKFDIERMIDEMEAYLLRVAGADDEEQYAYAV